MGEDVSLVREPDARDPPVRFDERRLETDESTRTETPAPPVNGYSPRHAHCASRRLYSLRDGNRSLSLEHWRAGETLAALAYTKNL